MPRHKRRLSMKIYLSADIEGITGIVDPSETVQSETGNYDLFALQMSREVAAACEGASIAGAKEIWIKDAHGNGKNILPYELPINTKLIRGWFRHPFSMMEGLDDSFDAILMIGYHSPAGSEDNPLAHTINSRKFHKIYLNAHLMSEFLLNAYIAAYVGVPVVFLSGDAGICEGVKALNPNISALSVNQGIGSGVISIHPQLALASISESVESALLGNLSDCLIELPQDFTLSISYIHHKDAYRAAFYPGAIRESSNRVSFYHQDFFEILRFLYFA